MSTRANITVNNKTEYTLSIFKKWGGPWGKEPPKQIKPNEQNFTFSLNDYDRAGAVYLATDKDGNEFGFVTMSFTCPKSSSNSAEGSPDMPGTFISAGLQKYKRSGAPVSFTYDIGKPNLACWEHGDSNNDDITCDQTTMKTWTRLFAIVKNPESEPLVYQGSWSWHDQWAKAPETIPKHGRRIFLLDDNDRAGIHYILKGMPFNLSFTCPKSSSNSAEGSAFCGLQRYERHGTPVSFTYEINSPNKACWNSGSSFNGKIECNETMITKVQNNWMGILKNNKQSFGAIKLGDLFFPGTHDSSCYEMNSPFSPHYAQTQSQKFYAQLKGGVRYLDLRLKWESKTSFRFVHGSWNTNAYLKDLLSALKEFYSDASCAQEVVILDFGHFDNFDSSTEKYQDFVNVLLESEVKDKFSEKLDYKSNLNDIWNNKKNIIVSMSHSIGGLDTAGLISQKNDLFASAKKDVPFWPDTNSLSEMNEALNKVLEQDYQQKLWKLQNILTPRWYSSSINILAAEANPSLYEHLETKSTWRDSTNIAIIDYYANDLPGIRANLKHLDNQLAAYALIINWNRSV